MSSKPWYDKGLRFECTQCGQCCKNHGQYTFVNLSERDLERIPKFLGLSRRDFLDRFCTVTPGYFPSLKFDELACPFLDEKNRCRIYPVRPKQCETWPFWTENLVPAVWSGEVKDCCPGIDAGPLYEREEIERRAEATEQDFR
jgi:Fe-S-cluster containining protein